MLEFEPLLNNDYSCHLKDKNGQKSSITIYLKAPVDKNSSLWLFKILSYNDTKAVDVFKAKNYEEAVQKVEDEIAKTLTSQINFYQNIINLTKYNAKGEN